MKHLWLLFYYFWTSHKDFPDTSCASEWLLYKGNTMVPISHLGGHIPSKRALQPVQP